MVQGFFNQVYYVCGNINSTGAIATYTGNTFTVSKTVTGQYNLTFTTPHPRSIYPVMVNANTQNSVWCTMSTQSNTGFRVNCFNSSGATDSWFSFLVFL